MSDIQDLYKGLPSCETPKLINSVPTRYANTELLQLANVANYERDERRKEIAIREIEEKLVAVGDCSSTGEPIVKNFTTKLHLLADNDEKLQNILRTEDTLQQDVHQNISCLVSAILGETQIPVPNKLHKIHNWFRGLKQIGEESVEGYAIRASFTPANELFIIKSARNVSADELVHEALAGLYVTNTLRQYVPNFMYVYGYSKCSPPFINNREIVSWCNSTEGTNVSYLILENIRDSQTLENFIVNCSYEDFVKTILQLFSALNMAYRYFGFVHHDLHLKNVMVRRFNSGKPVAVKIYSFDGNVEQIGYITTEYVPYFIYYFFS